MDKAYLRPIGELFAKKVGPRFLGTTGRVIGRVAGALALAWTIYDFRNNLNKNLENEPVFQEMAKHQVEFENWDSAISCMGKSAYNAGKFGSLHEGGCINALSIKKTLNIDQKFYVNTGFIDPDPKLAKELLERAVDYIGQTENLIDEEDFENRREDLVERLKTLNDQIEYPYQPDTDYSSIQQELSDIVETLKPVKLFYKTKVYQCHMELEKTYPRNTAWAAASALTMGFIKKKKE
ncbi:MAG: hypothetical protein ISS23_02080 [Nanoarchaeota archaeon]|nr:hypothetical protein [Nanoarchaeota archaeon]